ncbi:hypothetical protein OA86_10795 [Kaistella jeonii]|uniref:Uncharacterized protein n=1 Tax=Kaistella jeonii TaxID=266749 RepID=A0A0C1D3Z6_9FLAO|nr:hypothetical protein OA86_10795 [Kaistella jeonii]
MLLFVSRQKVRRIKEFTYFNATNTNNPDHQKASFPQPLLRQVLRQAQYGTQHKKGWKLSSQSSNLQSILPDLGAICVKKKGNVFHELSMKYP